MVNFQALTPSEAQVLRAAINTAIREGHTGMPAAVLDFDDSTATCTVQPLLIKVYMDEHRALFQQLLPPIHKVPVCFPSGGGFVIRWPLSSEDTVYLAFAERSLDSWKNRTGTGPQQQLPIEPVASHVADLSDAVAVACLRAPGVAGANPGGPEALFLGTADGLGIVLTSSEVRVGGIDAVSPAVKGDALAQWAALAVCPTPGGPAHFAVPLPSSVFSTIVKIK